jgi:site-specific recombinase XerD
LFTVFTESIVLSALSFSRNLSPFITQIVTQIVTHFMRVKKAVQNTFTLSVYLHNRKRKDGEHYIMIRLSHRGKRYTFATGHTAKIGEWIKSKGQVNKKHPEHNRINSELAETIAHAKKVIALSDMQGTVLGSHEIAALLGRDPIAKQALGVLNFSAELISELKAVSKIGNAKVYLHIYNSLSKYLQGKDITFDRFDYTFLRKYETHLKARGLKDTSMSLHFRTLRAIYREAINRKLASESAYPFKTFKVSKFSVETQPRAISKHEIKALERLSLSPEAFVFDARNYFLFSYYGCGINFVDLAKLRWQDIEGEFISYTRQKTGKLITFKILPNLREMLDYYGAFTGGHHANYIFPILNKATHITPKQIDYRIDKVEKRVSKALREISDMAWLTKHITYYVARHTFANELQLAGEPVSKIAQLLGHEERVTRIYLSKFSNDQLFTALDKLF